MPRASGEYSLRRMCAAWALSPAALPCCFCQYCMTMATLAAPHPFFSCFTNGTSSHGAEGSAASSLPQQRKRKMISLAVPRSMPPLLANCHDDQDNDRDAQDDKNQVAIAQGSGSKI